MRATRIIGASVAGLLALTAAACGSSGSSTSVNLVAYSTPQKVYAKLIPAFQATSAGKGAKFTTSYGASGSQSRAVIAGQPADVVEFSTEPDMAKLVSAKLVSSSWDANSYGGMITDSVVVLVVRKGNPLGIHSFADLTKPGVKVVTPNPNSSGSARWNIMALYGSALKSGDTPAQAVTFVTDVLKNTVSQPTSGSQATSAFVSGTGNVLISYENEAIEAQQAGEPVDYVIPSDTILIQNPIAVTTNAKDPALAKKFVSYLYSNPAQKIFASEGYRPVVKSDLSTSQFPTPSGLFTIDSLGGWSSVTTKFFDPTNGIFTKIENSLGATASG